MATIEQHSITAPKFQIDGADVVYIREGRIRPHERHEGLYYYDMRHGDDGDFSEPVTIERSVLVNFFGTLVTRKPIPCLEEEGYMELNDEMVDLIINHRD